MFLLEKSTKKSRLNHEFSSPIFGDMFLLARSSYFHLICQLMFSSPIFGDMFLLYLSCFGCLLGLQFSSPIFGDMFLLLKTMKAIDDFEFSSPIFGDMFLLNHVGNYIMTLCREVFVSYIRRYVLTIDRIVNPCWLYHTFSSPIFGDMFLLRCDEETRL